MKPEDFDEFITLTGGEPHITVRSVEFIQLMLNTELNKLSGLGKHIAYEKDKKDKHYTKLYEESAAKAGALSMALLSQLERYYK